MTISTYDKVLKEFVSRDVGSKFQHFKNGDRVVCIAIEDTGKGIPQETLNSIFEPFFTSQPTGKGKGLGLTVTKSIIEMHHGMLEINNVESGGVRIVLTLPCSK